VCAERGDTQNATPLRRADRTPSIIAGTSGGIEPLFAPYRRDTRRRRALAR
jgi:hypothetical protein